MGTYRIRCTFLDKKVKVSRGWRPDHYGVDSFPITTTKPARGNFAIVSVADGMVKRIDYDIVHGGGNFVTISHGRNIYGEEITTSYLHLSSVDLKEGEFIGKDQIIGMLGNTHKSAWHSHYQIEVDGWQIDTRFINVERLIFNPSIYSIPPIYNFSAIYQSIFYDYFNIYGYYGSSSGGGGGCYFSFTGKFSW